MRSDGIVAVEEWHLAEGGVEYRYDFLQTELGTQTIGQTQRCGPTGQQVLRAVEATGTGRQDTIAVDETFASEALAMLVAARIATDPNPRPVIVSQIDAFTTGTAYQVMKPLGKTAPPGSVLKDPAWTVRVTLDYSPEPLLLYFDEQGDLLAASLDGQRWRERIDEPIEADEESRGPAKRAKK